MTLDALPPLADADIDAVCGAGPTDCFPAPWTPEPTVCWPWGDDPVLVCD